MNRMVDKHTLFHFQRRALKLQQQKHKEEFHRARQQEKEIEKEQMLTARIAHP